MGKNLLSGPSMIKGSHSVTHNPDVGEDWGIEIKIIFHSYVSYPCWL